MKTIQCNVCFKEKGIDNFYTQSYNKDLYIYTCKPCYSLKNKKDVNKKYLTSIARKYGISIKDYLDMRKSQNDRCKICGGSDSRRLSIDHCHTTNEVRGLLCSACNKGLGYFKDNIEILIKAAEYLQEDEDEQDNNKQI